MILFDSVYINNGGGKVLLDYFLPNIYDEAREQYFLLDERCRGQYAFIKYFQKEFISNSYTKRLTFYSKRINTFKKIFCFGNVPPPVKCNASVYTYFHNLLLCQPNGEFIMRDRTLFHFKRLALKRILNNSDYFIVQTEYVKWCLSKYFKMAEKKILIIPFFENSQQQAGFNKKKPNHFVYVSDGNSYKNHNILLDAWESVNRIKPELILHLTVSSHYPNLKKRIENSQNNGLNIVNHGIVSKAELDAIYSECYFTVYPSRIESFGLGLIEALQNNCHVLAADRPYVHAICKPFAIFDDSSSKDIAQTILNAYEGVNRNNGSSLLVKNEFPKLKNILG